MSNTYHSLLLYHKTILKFRTRHSTMLLKFLKCAHSATLSSNMFQTSIHFCEFSCLIYKLTFLSENVQHNLKAIQVNKKITFDPSLIKATKSLCMVFSDSNCTSSNQDKTNEDGMYLRCLVANFYDQLVLASSLYFQ